MWQCSICGQWVYQYGSHICNPPVQQPTYVLLPLPEKLQPTLERIAKALETLIEQNKKEV